MQYHTSIIWNWKMRNLKKDLKFNLLKKLLNNQLVTHVPFCRWLTLLLRVIRILFITIRSFSQIWNPIQRVPKKQQLIHLTPLFNTQNDELHNYTVFKTNLQWWNKQNAVISKKNNVALESSQNSVYGEFYVWLKPCTLDATNCVTFVDRLKRRSAMDAYLLTVPKR